MAVTYGCDRCGVAVENEKQFFSLTIIRYDKRLGDTDMVVTPFIRELCQKCVSEVQDFAADSPNPGSQGQV